MVKWLFLFFRYKFDKEKWKEAHEYCQQQAASAVRQNSHVVVIDNPCVQNWEMKFYLKLAKAHKYIPVVVEPQTPWAMVFTELAVRNINNKYGKIFANKVRNKIFTDKVNILKNPLNFLLHNSKAR